MNDRIIIPKLATGIARNKTESQYPQLWDGLIGLWSPNIEHTPGQMRNVIGYSPEAVGVGSSPVDETYNKWGTMIDYNGSSDGFDCGRQHKLEGNSTQKQSVTFLMESDVVQTQSALIWYQVTLLSPSAGFYIMLKTTLTVGGFCDTAERNTSVIVQDGDPHWVTVVARENALEVWKDGQLAYTVGATIGHASAGATHKLRIADHSNVNYYNGRMGDVFLHDRDLKPTEIALLHQGASPLQLSQIPIVGMEGTPSASLDETATLDDDWSILSNQFEAELTDTATLSDSWDILLSTVYATLTDTVTLDDAWSILESVVYATLTDTATLDDDWDIATTELVSYATQILHYNPLIFVTDTNPVKLVSVDISVPETPVKSVYTLTGYSGASDIALNETNEYFYITVAGGKVLKIEKADLNNITEIDTIDTDELVNVDTLDDSFLTFASTDYSTGEVIKIDEREIKNFNSDIRWIAQKSKILTLKLNTILAKLLNNDLRYIANVNKIFKSDFRWLKTAYSNINNDPIDYTDIQIKINNVDMIPLNDVDMSTVQIVHTIDEKSIASFRLSRRHDKLDYTNTGASSQITNNNAVVIIIDGHTEFSGKIASINSESETETTFVTAKMDAPTSRQQTVNIPMASLDENINLYQCMVNNTTIDNPYIDSNNDNPEYYKGIKIQLGTQIEQVVSSSKLIEIITDGQGIYATQIEEGTFDIWAGYTYFWRVDFLNFLTGVKREGLGTYIGTSLGSLSTDTYKITAVSPIWQKVRDDIEIELDEWTIGEAPFQEISVKNGRKITKAKYRDEMGGLYFVQDEGYNYVPYAIRVAQLEYEKIQNINGDVLPIVNSSIDVTLDAYYYYGLKLLTRVNVTNTTTSDIYKNSNGFPVAIKSINITFNTDSRMMVTLQCDNQKSLQELEVIDARYPDEESDEYLFPETSKFVTQKYDLSSMTDGGFFNFPDLPTDDIFQKIMDDINSIWP